MILLNFSVILRGTLIFLTYSKTTSLIFSHANTLMGRLHVSKSLKNYFIYLLER